MTMKEAEAYLGVTRRTLYRYIAREQEPLPAIKNKLTGRIMFEEEDLKRFRELSEEWVPVRPASKSRKHSKP